MPPFAFTKRKGRSVDVAHTVLSVDTIAVAIADAVTDTAVTALAANVISKEQAQQEQKQRMHEVRNNFNYIVLRAENSLSRF